MDVFAQIAKEGIGGCSELLYDPQPAILTSGNMDADGKWKPTMACGEKEYDGKRYAICQVDLREENPAAKIFKKALYE